MTATNTHVEADARPYPYVINSPLSFTDPYGLEHVQEPGFTRPLTPGNVGDLWGTLFATIPPIACAQWTRDAVRRLPAVSNDRYQHCLASCRIRRDCGGLVVAEAAGVGREVAQAVAHPLDLRPRDTCGDLRANQVGMTAPSDLSCEAHCSRVYNPGAGPAGSTSR
jgi:hypothetical protein